ncbi:hypothetical protein RRG08_056540 [Elysia crispata]|uniref:CUB domain-containing protein n=1 Tax=Elysia crispata TaxID=231223 RepID=A0AAE1BCY6_9GAST|nr:hypothetical protein RRG08_056540 [Elysia crispata]
MNFILCFVTILTLTVFSPTFLASEKSMSHCGIIEEGTGHLLTCSANRQSFGRLSFLIEINQTFQELSYCDSNGICHDNYPTRFATTFEYNNNTDNNEVALDIFALTRDLNKLHCYLDDTPYAGCLFTTYIAPAKPICSGPEFVEDGRAAILTCSSDPVYPTARCGTAMSLTDIAEGRYEFDIDFYVEVHGRKTNITEADTIPALELRATSLENPNRGSQQILNSRKPQELKVNISVISNPPPKSFSLAVSHDESQTPVTVPSHLFSVRYRSRGHTDLRGTIELSVLTAAVTVHERFNYFIFSASNGVVGSKPTLLQFKFTWIRLDFLPTQPTCDAPVFVDEGATALITCTADRAHSQSVDVSPYIRARNSDSTAYPGQQTVTCELRLPVAGNRAGEYQFQVEITPSISSGNQSVFVTTPIVTVNLGEKSISHCGIFEEGTGTFLTCRANRNSFGRLSFLIEVNQTFQELSYCDSNGICHDNDPTRFATTFEYDNSTDKNEVALHIFALTRDMKKMHCYLDDTPFAGCLFTTYIAPAKPICNGPEFAEDGRAAILTCSSDPVYPTAGCRTTISTFHHNTVSLKDRMSVEHNLTDSEQYPGNKNLTCLFKLQLTDIAEGRYEFDIDFYVEVHGRKTNTTEADTIPALELRATSLENPNRGSRQILNSRKPQELKVNISVISNPPPNSFSLAVSHDESQTPVTVPSDLFSVQYRSREHTDLRGTIELSVLTAAVTVHERFNYFIFSASNGVVGSRPTLLQFKFTWIRLDFLPTQPTCDAPVFVDEGATALITCTADRANSQSADVPPRIRARNSDSTAYPGQQTVTCELRLPVAGNRAGQYQFQVEITPSFTSGNQSVFVTTPNVTVNSENAQPQGNKSWSIDLLPIVGGAAAGLFLIVLLVLTVIVLRRKRNAQNSDSDHMSNQIGKFDSAISFTNKEFVKN